jgi:putative chitinase
MAVAVTLEQIARLAPSARSSYRDAFAAGAPVLARYGIGERRLRVAHFMAQVLHECGALTLQFESLNYSAQRLPKVWPKRFKPIGPLDPAAFANRPEKLGDAVYGGRLGNDRPGDGFTYRGRGMLQLTGKGSYADMTRQLRRVFPTAPDFVANPDAVISAEWSLHVAAAKWAASGCNALADLDNLRAVTKAINGGTVGLSDRGEWLLRTKFIWP